MPFGTLIGITNSLLFFLPVIRALVSFGRGKLNQRDEFLSNGGFSPTEFEEMEFPLDLTIITFVESLIRNINNEAKI